MSDYLGGINITARAVGFLVVLLALCGCGDETLCPRRDEPCRNEPYSAPTLIGDLYSYCFSESRDCNGRTVDVQLYLDTVNLPSVNQGGSFIVLSSVPTTPIAGQDRLGFNFEGTLPDSIDPGIVDQVGWKARVSGATIEVCPDCYTDCGRAYILSLTGRLEDVVFIYDPADTGGIYIRVELGPGECEVCGNR